MTDPQLPQLQVENEGLRQELTQVKRENARLKRMPLFLAAVVEVMEDGGVHLRQLGNNQEYLTQVGGEIHGMLKPGMRVAVNNALCVVKILADPGMPLFVASVVRVMEGGEVHLMQQGNSLEYITRVDRELHGKLKPGTRVAVNNALFVVKVIEGP